jgi:AI-2 transport protein TqsA
MNENKSAPSAKEADLVYRNINTACLIVIAAVCITMALIYTKSILIPLVISVFIYTMMAPIIRYMRFKFRVPRWLAVVAASVLVIGPLVLLIIFLINSVANFVQVAGTYQEKLVQSFNWLVNFTKGYNLPLPEDAFDLHNIASMISGQQVSNFLRGFGGVTMQIFSYSTLIFLFVFFFLIGSGRSASASGVIKEVQNRISVYLFVHIIISLATGFFCAIVYFSIGLELAVMFAVLTVLLNFIPSVGSIIAVLLPLPIALIQFGLGAEFWVVLAIPSFIQFGLGSILEPKLLGHGLDLHPVAIVGSLVFWSLVWGVPGAFLALPITSAVRLILSKLEPTQAFAEILAGRLPE